MANAINAGGGIDQEGVGAACVPWEQSLNATGGRVDLVQWKVTTTSSGSRSGHEDIQMNQLVSESESDWDGPDHRRAGQFDYDSRWDRLQEGVTYRFSDFPPRAVFVRQSPVVEILYIAATVRSPTTTALISLGGLFTFS